MGISANTASSTSIVCLYPYHLAISPDWLVHYFSSRYAGPCVEVRRRSRFLADWQTTLGEKAAQAIADIGRQLGLEYCGIDFTLLPNGQLLDSKPTPQC